MDKVFTEVKLFKVKPSKIDEFEGLMARISKEQRKQQGCIIGLLV